MHPSEIEFMAENEIIQIVPTFNHTSHVHLICGSYGPFRAGLPLNVPVWVALNLRQKKTCRILAPDWMTVDYLHERLEEEKKCKYVHRYRTQWRPQFVFSMYACYLQYDCFFCALLDFSRNCRPTIIWKSHKCYCPSLVKIFHKETK